MLNTVKQYIDDNHLLDNGEQLLIGVSGGADSMCLLVVMNELSLIYGTKITVVHVNHEIRGSEADGDEAYVRDYCEEGGIDFVSRHVDVPALAKTEEGSLEEIARYARHRAFEDVCRERGIKKVALAHHMDDQAETVLFQLFRGSGIEGMKGMLPKRSGSITYIRPLLGITRLQIEECLRLKGVSYRTDSTNLSNDYSRNKIRNQLLPFVQTELNQGAVRHIAALAEECSKAWDFIERETETKFQEYAIKKDGGITFALDGIGSEPELMQQELVRKGWLELKGSLKDFTRGHVADILKLRGMQVGKRIMLPGGHYAERGYDSLSIREVKNAPKFYLEIKMNDCKEKVIELSEHGIRLIFRLFEYKKNDLIPKKSYTKWFDYDKMKNNIVIRTREAGDFLIIFNTSLTGGEIRQHGRKTLKSFFIDMKIPREERESQLLLAEGSHVLWVIGRKSSEGCLVDENTKRILEVSCQGD